MDLTQYGPFAAVIAIAAALVAAFGWTLLNAMGRIPKWAELTHDTPTFMVTTGARALAVALIALTFLSITKDNWPWFVAAAIVFGILAILLIGSFDRLRKVHIHKIPEVQSNGSQAVDEKGKPMYRTVVIGTEATMRDAAKKAFKKHPGISLTQFMSGFGQPPNDPAAIWERSLLAEISSKMTMRLLWIMLCAVMALYIAASAVEVTLRAPGAAQSAP